MRDAKDTNKIGRVVNTTGQERTNSLFSIISFFFFNFSYFKIKIQKSKMTDQDSHRSEMITQLLRHVT